MKTRVSDGTNIELVEDVQTYLYDAGFDKDLYTIDDFDNTRGYVEVFFIAYDAVDYVLKDVRKSEYSYLLEIKKYRYRGGICSAIIAYLD